LFLYMLDYDPPWTWKINDLHLHAWIPIETEQELSFSLVTTFFNMSVGLWLVCIFSHFNCPSSKMDRMKWYLIGISVVFEWKFKFFAVILTIGENNTIFLFISHYIAWTPLYSSTIT
jgi:hypothetical protein